MERLKIRVVEIRGKCPVFKKGDSIVVEGPQVNLRETDALCTHAFASFLPHLVALRKGIKPSELGLGRGRKRTFSASIPERRTQMEGRLYLR